jgi:UDP-N-acetylglucosamine 2-epimerase (non-hydrolysing)
MELTDSGSIQEELNELPQTICCTMRFSTDRPESIFDAHSNLLIPPLSEDLIFNILKHVLNNESIHKSMKSAKKIYGENVGKKIIEYLIREMNSNASIFRWTHQTLYNLPDEEDIDYL